MGSLPPKVLKITFLLALWLSNTSLIANPGTNIMRNLGIGFLVGGVNFTVLQCTSKNKEKNPIIHPLRNHLTSVYSGTGAFSLLSGVPPIRVMGIGFLSLSAWGHYLAFKKPEEDQTKTICADEPN